MSYLVLARKYRPKTFAQMVGQEHVVQALSNALTTGRLHHAYMFTGTRGVGKTTVSRILAKSLNCTGPDGQGGVTAQPCGVCQACTEIDAGRFVDYTELDAASNRGVDEVQGLLEQAVYKPVQGRFKVFMIDEVHMLTNTAFNAMLKTLEEPPEYLKFVLATTDPQKVPVTVLSRCLQFNLRPMAPDTVLAHLQHVLQEEHIPAESGALHLLARAARGSMRDALSLTDQAIAFSAGQGGDAGLQTAAIRQMLGNVDSSHVFRLIEALAQHAPAEILDIVGQLQEHGLSAAHTLEEMTRVLQRMAVWQMVPDAPPDGNPDDEEIRRLADLLPPDETQLLYSLCLHGRQELGLAPDEYAALTMVLFRLMPFRQPGSATEASAEKKTLKTADTTVGAPAAPVAPVAPVARPVPTRSSGANEDVSRQRAVTVPPWEEIPPDDADLLPPAPENTSGLNDGLELVRLPVIEQPASAPPPAMPTSTVAPARRLVSTEAGDIWHILAESILQQGLLSGISRELLLQSQLLAQEEQVWVLRVESETLNHAPSRKRLEHVLAGLGHAVSVRVEFGRVVDTPALRLASARAEQLQRAQHAFQSHPYVQAMMRDLGAQSVPDSIAVVPAVSESGAPTHNH